MFSNNDKNSNNIAAEEIYGRLKSAQLTYPVVGLEEKAGTVTIKFNAGINFKNHLSLIMSHLGTFKKFYAFLLDGCELKDEGIKNLISNIQSNKVNVVGLDLSNNGITDKSCAAISNLISNSNLEFLYLSDNNITEEGCKILKEGVFYNTTLTDLELRSNNIRKPLYEVNEHLQILTDKVSLNLQNLNKERTKAREQEEREKKRQNALEEQQQREKEKTFQVNNVKDSNEILNQTENDKVVINIVNGNNPIEEKFRNFLGVDFVKKNDSTVSIKFTKKIIDLNYLEIAILILARHSDYYYSLDFEGCDLKNEGVNRLIKAILAKKINIIELNLNRNEITDDSASSIVLLIHYSVIRKLAIGNSPLSLSGLPRLSQMAMERIAKAIFQNSTLVDFNFAGNPCSHKLGIEHHIEANKKMREAAEKNTELLPREKAVKLKEQKMETPEVDKDRLSLDHMFLLAVTNGHSDVAVFIAGKIKLDRGNQEENRLLLQNICLNLDFEAIQTISHNFPKDNIEMFISVSDQINEPKVKQLLLDWAISIGAEKGDIKQMEKALDKGGDVNSMPDGSGSPLHKATKKSQKEAIKFLLEHKADLDCKDRSGKKPEELLDKNSPIKKIFTDFKDKAKKMPIVKRQLWNYIGRNKLVPKAVETAENAKKELIDQGDKFLQNIRQTKKYAQAKEVTDLLAKYDAGNPMSFYQLRKAITGQPVKEHDVTVKIEGIPTVVRKVKY